MAVSSQQAQRQSFHGSESGFSFRVHPPCHAKLPDNSKRDDAWSPPTRSPATSKLT
jgi:hypothetical protein